MATQVFEDAEGNLIEDDPMQRRHRPGVPEPGPVDAANVAAAQSDKAGDAAKAIDAGGPASLTHGANAGVSNMLNLRQWKKDEDK